MTIKLNAGDIVFNPAWTDAHLFEVGSIEAYAKQYNEDPAARREKALERGHDIAWANKCCISIDDSGHSFKRRQERLARAISIENGQEVEIEGNVYVTRLIGKQYSDGIKFKKAVGA